VQSSARIATLIQSSQMGTQGSSPYRLISMLQTFSQNEEKPMFYKVTEVSMHFKVSPATIWRWTREGRFPQPVKLGSGTTRWREDDLQTFEKKLK